MSFYFYHVHILKHLDLHIIADKQVGHKISRAAPKEAKVLSAKRLTDSTQTLLSLMCPHVVKECDFDSYKCTWCHQ